uniref:Uncharacterized protein n=1 Tax=Anopheles culicifacies TaxID=139723 RepID=A0A182MMP9_9DIPT
MVPLYGSGVPLVKDAMVVRCSGELKLDGRKRTPHCTVVSSGSRCMLLMVSCFVVNIVCKPQIFGIVLLVYRRHRTVECSIKRPLPPPFIPARVNPWPNFGEF